MGPIQAPETDCYLCKVDIPLGYCYKTEIEGVICFVHIECGEAYVEVTGLPAYTLHKYQRITTALDLEKLQSKKD